MTDVTQGPSLGAGAAGTCFAGFVKLEHCRGLDTYAVAWEIRYGPAYEAAVTEDELAEAVGLLSRLRLLEKRGVPWIERQAVSERLMELGIILGPSPGDDGA